MKIDDKINAILEAEKDLPESEKQTFYSYEYFPPKTAAGEENLVERIGRMATTNPLWVDVTWGAGGSTFDTTLDLCGHMQQYMGLDVLMHLTCTGMTRERVIESLDKAKEYGIRNILALRGDPPMGVDNWTPVENGFSYATQLVAFIKERYGDFFCVVVAGYPEVHAQATSREDDIKHLKEKCDAGADIVVTQLFYNNEIFFEWVKDCRKAGITARIVPGLMPILGYDRFARTIKFCKTNVPPQIAADLEARKNDDEKVREYGVEHGVQMCKELMEGGCKFLHFYTMNLEASVVRIIKGLGILKSKKQLPFAQPTTPQRQSEEVRPIFWANKPMSYIAKTAQWDEFPNGRWGDMTSPAFSQGFDCDDSEEDVSGFRSYSKKFREVNVPEKRKAWGATCTNLKDISTVFQNYINGKIKKFPFSEGGLAAETGPLTDFLSNMNQNLMYTINSQPQVNACPSTDSTHGWGPEGGYVYQKAYIEFFIPGELVMLLKAHLDTKPTVTYQAMNLGGNCITNCKQQNNVNAVTWGAFPGREIVQPTIVDQTAFKIWKDEALKAFTSTWAVIYKPQQTKPDAEPDQGSEDSVKFLTTCHQSFYLMNVVENDFIGGNLQQAINEFIAVNADTIKTLTDGCYNQEKA